MRWSIAGTGSGGAASRNSQAVGTGRVHRGGGGGDEGSFGARPCRNACRRARQLVLRRGRRNEAVLAEALPAIVETARRELGPPYREQILGALALSHGYLGEMATGEGEDLTIAARGGQPIGWTALPCHVLTANDYLAARDATELGAVLQGVRAPLGAHRLADESGREARPAYAADVVYTTSKELVADFLRDRLHSATLAEPGRRMVARFLAPENGRPVPGAARDCTR